MQTKTPGVVKVFASLYKIEKFYVGMDLIKVILRFPLLCLFEFYFTH